MRWHFDTQGKQHESYNLGFKNPQKSSFSSGKCKVDETLSSALDTFD